MDWSKVFAPLKALFQDRIVVTAILSALGAMLANLVPAIEPYMSLIVPALIAVVLMAAAQTAVTAPFKVMAAAKPPMAFIQGATPLKPLTEFSENELRAIAYKLGALPPGDISRDGLVMSILRATTPQAAHG